MARERPSRVKIQAILEKRVAPFAALENGTVEAVRYARKGGQVLLRFGGAYECSPARAIMTELVIKPVLEEVFYGIKNLDYVD